MADFVIIPDSSSDMNTSLMKRFGIPDIRMGNVVFPDGENRKVDIDWETMKPEEYFTMMKDKKNVFKSATPILEEDVELFKKYLAMGKDILCISLSGTMSGTHSLALLAAKSALEEYPERKIICVDSLKYSGAIILLIIKAAELKNQGKSIEETAAWLEENKNRLHQAGPMDDLFYLASKGRISNFKAFFGTMAGVNPLADFNRNGFSEVITKCKGKNMAFDVSLEYMKKTILTPEDQIIFISHSNRKMFAEKYAEMIKEALNPREIIILDVGMGCGANIGPGLVAAFYFGTEISENLEKEKALMREIVDNYKKL